MTRYCVRTSCPGTPTEPGLLERFEALDITGCSLSTLRAEPA